MGNEEARPKPAAGLYIGSISVGFLAALFYMVAVLASTSTLYGPERPNGVFLALGVLTALVAAVLGIIATYRLLSSVDWLVSRAPAMTAETSDGTPSTISAEQV